MQKSVTLLLSKIEFTKNISHTESFQNDLQSYFAQGGKTVADRKQKISQFDDEFEAILNFSEKNGALFIAFGRFKHGENIAITSDILDKQNISVSDLISEKDATLILQSYTYLYIKNDCMVIKIDRSITNRQIENHINYLIPNKNYQLTLPQGKLEDTEIEKIQSIKVGGGYLKPSTGDQSIKTKRSKIKKALYPLLQSIFDSDSEKTIECYLEDDVIDIFLDIKFKQKNINRNEAYKQALSRQLRHIDDEDITIKTKDGSFKNGVTNRIKEVLKISATSNGLLSEITLIQEMNNFLNKHANQT
jgi:hypothetical protein